jgi:Spy/CpxP family protein refolding chaperone
MRFGKIVRIGLLVAVCCMAPRFAQAREGMHDGDMAFGRQLFHALNLTDDQKAQVREAFGTYRAAVQPLWKEMQTTRQQLQDVLLNPNGLDNAALQTAQQHLTGLQADLLQARITLAQTLRGVLTPTQLTHSESTPCAMKAFPHKRLCDFPISSSDSKTCLKRYKIKTNLVSVGRP